MQSSFRALLAAVAGLSLLASCGAEEASTEDAGTGDTGVADAGAESADPDDTRPMVVVTTNILGDVVENLVGGEVEVVTIMPVGADPHDFQASAQQVAQIGEADLLVTNGAGFEQGILDVIESAEADGVPTFEATSVIETLDFGDEEHADEEEHGHEGVDPHFFTDPARMVAVAQGIVDALVATDGIDGAAVEAEAAPYLTELESLDAEVEHTLADIPDDSRVLVTNHEVFGYFADRYDFEVVGTVIPGGTTAEGASGGELAALAEVIEREGIPAIFADTSSSDELARALADQVGEIEVVELYSESLGEDGSEGATYLGMMRVDAQRIADALAG